MGISHPFPAQAENAAALAAQLSLVDASFFRCVDYDALGDARAWGATAAWLHPGLGGGGLCRNQPLVWVVLTKLENSLARSNRSRFG